MPTARRRSHAPPARHRDGHHRPLPLPLRRPLADDASRSSPTAARTTARTSSTAGRRARSRRTRAPRRRAAATRRRTPTGAARRPCSARRSARCARSARRGARTPAPTSSAARPSTATRCARRPGCACTSSRRWTASTRSGTSTPAASTRFYNSRNPAGVTIDGRNDEAFGNLDDPCNAHYDANDTSAARPDLPHAVRAVHASCQAALPPERRPGRPDVQRRQRVAGLGVTSGPYGTIVDRIHVATSTDLTPGGAAQSMAAVPYYRDDSCFDDGTGSDPGPKLHLRSADEPAVARRRHAAQVLAPGRRRSGRQRPLLPGLDRHARPAPAVPRRLRQRAPDRAADRDRPRLADGHAARRAARPPASSTAAASRSRCWRSSPTGRRCADAGRRMAAVEIRVARRPPRGRQPAGRRPPGRGGRRGRRPAPRRSPSRSHRRPRRRSAAPAQAQAQAPLREAKRQARTAHKKHKRRR